MRKGAAWLKTTLVQCATAAARKKASYLQAQFHRLRARRGVKKAYGALAASILTAAYHMLISGELYRDLGLAHFDPKAKAAHTHRLVTRLQNLGDAVQITPLAGIIGVSVFLAWEPGWLRGGVVESAKLQDWDYT
jgi:transposase